MSGGAEVDPKALEQQEEELLQSRATSAFLEMIKWYKINLITRSILKFICATMNFDRILLKCINTKLQGDTRNRNLDKDAAKGTKDKGLVEVMVSHRAVSSAQPVQGHPWPNP